MKRKQKSLLVGVLSLATITSLGAQKIAHPSKGALLDGKTIIKTNMISNAIGSYNLNLERALTKNISVQVGFSTMPTRGIPFVSSLGKLSSDINLSQIQMNGKSFTVDFRLYLSKTGYGHGFYIQPYFRHESYSINNIGLDKSNTKEAHPYTLSTKLGANSGGLSIGCQWLIGSGKNIVIDLALGAHFSGTTRSELNAVSNKDLNLADQGLAAKTFGDDLKKAIDELKVFKNTTVDVSPDFKVIKASAEHPYGFLRGNLSIGFRF